MKKKYNTKMAVNAAGIGYRLRIFERKQKGINSRRFLIKCGDCDGQVEIYSGNEDDLLEINGVCASRKEWGKILLPLLKVRKENESK